jgi:hypothetical protein
MTAGYSGTPLAKKLGFKPGTRVKTMQAPPNYRELVAPLPQGCRVSSRLRPPVDVLHAFVRTRRELDEALDTGLMAIHPAGMIWASWPKKASGVASEITEDVIREMAFPLGLVDVKVCAVDDTWSGLKLVIRKENRK